LGALLLLLLALPTPPGLSEASSPPKRSSSAIAITADGGTLLVVNPDSNSLTLVDTASNDVVAELAVGTDPRTVAVDDQGQRAYVANRGSDSVSVVDLKARAVLAEVSVGHRPYGVVVDPAGDRVYLAEQGANRVRILDTSEFATRALLPIGERPSGLALSQDGATLYVTHLLTNTVTALKPRFSVVYLPLIFKGDTGQGPAADPAAGGQAGDAPGAQVWSGKSSSIRLWPDSNLVQSIVIAPGGRRAYVPHTRSSTANRALTFDTTVFPIVSLIDLETAEHLVGQQISLDTVDPPGVGLPYDAAFAPDGNKIWVLNAASNDITVVDLESHKRVAHIEVGDNPRGIVLSPDGQVAYVNNTLAGTVSVLDTATYTVTGIITTTDIPLPPVLLNGKRLFHSSDDARMARAQWISCNTCHFEGEQDGRTWFFGFAGPRNTTSLMGMIETYPLRWSGEWDESADSEFANRKENFGSGLLVGDMNCALSPPDCVHQPPNQGRSYDLDCLAAFLDSLRAPLSPDHAHGEPLDGAEQRGQAIYLDPDLGCVDCHPPPLYTDQLSHDVGTTTGDERIGPAYDTPTLRGLYGSAPYFHDGSAATLADALTRPSPGGEHDVRGLLGEGEIEDLSAFLRALPFE
jgi:YVTN family beta-propeller protein